MSYSRAIPRHELKYLLHYSQVNQILHLIAPFMRKDEYTDEFATTPILSLYYDSPHLGFYTEKLDGNEFRNKIRLRCYSNEFRDGEPAFVEIKQRVFDKVRKIRSLIPKFDTARHFDPANWPAEIADVRDNFGILIAQYNPRPVCKIFYLRKAFVGLRHKDLRITFDSQLLSLHPQETLTTSLFNDQSRFIIPDTLTILEIKATEDIPGWVFDLIKNFNLEQRPIPKYISGVEKLHLDHLNHEQGEYI